MRLFICTLFIALLMMGCSSTTPSINEYTLLSSRNTPDAHLPLTPKTLNIAPPKALSSLNSKSILYLRNDTESGNYLYSRWSDTPAALIQRSLIHSLQNDNLFSSVSPTSSLSQSDWLVESDLDAFYHRFVEDRSEGYIDITYRLINPKTKQIIASKRFTITTPAHSNDAIGGVDALKNALLELNIQCSAWLTTLIKENQ